ncbi:GNAT family N-acetyltransferase [Rhizobium sp. CRIBSB]|nr:GNAT family N-acetyltransferase [Rhizobium sp. CRIBSB]
MTLAHPLDRPVWNALTGPLAPFAIPDGPAVRLDPGIGVFLAAADEGADSRAALNRLHRAFPGSGLVEHSASPRVACLPDGEIASSSPCVQMICDALTAAREHPPQDVLALGEADAADMLGLATLTRPGPFRAGTARLGGFIGVRREGRLVAMAGTRLRVTGFTELSGVCVHPDWRGQGLAQGLSRLVCDRILSAGEQVFLHAYAGHAATIRLYERLGFSVRAPMTYTVMAQPEALA